MRNLKVILEGFRSQRVLVVGDLMLDSYWWGAARRISPEAPVPVFSLESESDRLGGAANVALNLSKLGASVSVCSVLGSDAAGDSVRSLLQRNHIDSSLVFTDSSRPTTIKRRVVAGNQQLLRIDTESVLPLADQTSREIVSGLGSELQKFDCVIISDYAKGLVTSALVGILVASGKPVFADPKGADYAKYRGCAVITPNQKEFSVAVTSFGIEQGELKTNALDLLGRIGVPKILVTRGSDGMTMITSDGDSFHRDATARKVYDVTGAGDTVIAVLSLALSSGLDDETAVEIANEAAGIAVETVGTTAVDAQTLLTRIIES